MRELVSALIDASPVPFVPVADLEMPAYYDSEQQSIFIRTGLNEEQLFVSMAKEVSAAVFDFKHNESREASEFKSYCVAYMVSARYGVDTRGFNFSRLPKELAETDNLTEEQETPDTLDVLQDEEPLMETTELEEFAPIDTEDDLLELSEEQLDVLSEPVEEVASEDLEVEDFTELTDDLSTSELAEDDLLEPQESLELNELSEEQPLGILDENLDDIADSITTTLEANIEENNEPTGKFKPMDYSVFDFTPQENNEEVDVDEIKANIEELDSKHPELNILKVYDLKYKNKNSVSEIATQLSMNEEQVVEALNEIIAVV